MDGRTDGRTDGQTFRLEDGSSDVWLESCHSSGGALVFRFVMFVGMIEVV